MEEDLKVLENIVERCKKCKFATCEQCEINWKQVQAIENLIKGYRELEKENHELKHENKRITDEYMIQKHLINKPFLDNNYIPKSKVREKIEKWESICRAEQLEGLNDNHAEYWSCFEDVLEKIKEQLLQEGDTNERKM